MSSDTQPTAVEAAAATEAAVAAAATPAPAVPVVEPSAVVTEPATEPAPKPAEEAATKPAEKAPAEVEEPQNALTEKFTEAEWKAVKELRSKLPEIFAKAYRERESIPTEITIWTVPLSPTPSAKGSIILMKFLRARDLHVANAAEMLTETLRWRDEFGIEKIMAEEFDESVFGGLGVVFGKDKEGHPVTYNLYGASDIKLVFGDVQRFLRWRVKFMEETIALLDFETIDQMVQVHDYAGVSFFSRDANQKAAAQEASSIFQNHYPEFLSRKYFINVATLLTWVFWMFKPLIPAKTLSKMAMVGTGPSAIHPELSKVISDDELPKRYGGKSTSFPADVKSA